MSGVELLYLTAAAEIWYNGYNNGIAIYAVTEANQTALHHRHSVISIVNH